MSFGPDSTCAKHGERRSWVSTPSWGIAWPSPWAKKPSAFWGVHCRTTFAELSMVEYDTLHGQCLPCWPTAIQLIDGCPCVIPPSVSRVENAYEWQAQRIQERCIHKMGPTYDCIPPSALPFTPASVSAPLQISWSKTPVFSRYKQIKTLDFLRENREIGLVAFPAFYRCVEVELDLFQFFCIEHKIAKIVHDCTRSIFYSGILDICVCKNWLFLPFALEQRHSIS